MSHLPKLRFKEFSGEWEEKKFDEFLKVIDGDRGVNYPKNEEFYEDEYCLFLNAKNVTKQGFSFQDNLFITEDKDKKLSKGKLEREDIVLTTRGSVGNFAYYTSDIPYKNMRINSGMVILRVNNTVNKSFIYKASFSPLMKKQIDIIAFGSAQPQLTVKEIKKFKIKLPSKSEQEKIASFLTSVDTKIELLVRKEELLQQYKKGVMQKIFSQEIRFKADDGSEYPKWEEKRLGDIFKFLRGSALSKADLVENGTTKCIHYGELFTIYDEMIKEVVSATNILEGQMSIVGDILMPSSDVTPLGLATASAIFEDNVILGGDTNILRPKTKLHSLYVSYYLNYDKQDIIKLVTGTTVKHIYNKDVALIKIPFPKYEEQTKIANFLSSIDTKIEHIQNQLNATKAFKKALLQQMFV